VGAPLRAYQRRAVDELLAALSEPGSRACLVAPPGAGKTRCALSVASSLACPVEVRVPTRALVEQWRARCVEQLGLVDDVVVNVCTYAAGEGFRPEALVVLDEAHHLLGRWAEQVEAALDGHRVLGLTGTPPQAVTGLDRFLTLAGDVVTVDAPPLVRSGHLAPYRDLVRLAVCELDDVPELAQATAVLRRWEQRLDVHAAVARALQASLLELTEDRFAGRGDLLIALCRVRASSGAGLPDDLPHDPELVAHPTLHDRARVLWMAVDADRRDALRADLKRLGLGARRASIVVERDVALSALGGAASRMAACLEVLALEWRARADDLRALVVTERDTEGGPLSARQVLRALVTDRVGDRLDPILVTGSVFWVDDDLWDRIGERLPERGWRAAGDHHELDVSGWSTGERVAFATALLVSGVTRCLVGTRHLLGEGWDCPAVNVCVDLTGIAAAVTANQVRGRALRPDPADPSKVASLWEVVAVMPGVAGGDRMLERLAERHEHTFGIDDAGQIRTGLGRVDPVLHRSLSTVLLQREALDRRMAERAADWRRTAELWAVGQDYRDERRWLVVAPPRKRPGTGQVLEKPLAPAATAIEVRRVREGWGAALLGLAGLGLAPLWWPASIALWALTAGAALRAWRRDVPGARLEAVAVGLGLGPVMHDRGRSWVEGAGSEAFAQAAAELLGPVRFPRYLLIDEGGRPWPVPSALGVDRGTADRFGAVWAEHVGACEVLWARQGRGRELLHAAWRSGGEPVEIVQTWT